MISIRQPAFVVACCLGSLQLSNGAFPPAEEIGQLLGYPHSELLIEDITPQERVLIQTPSRREQKRQTGLPNPAVLHKSYLIYAKNKKSFFPIYVSVGKKNAFLTPEVLDLLAEGDALPPNRQTSGTEGFASVGRGGGYFTQHFKVKSDSPPFNIADSVVANITVVQPHGQDFDIKIAQRLDQDLERIPGGEEYYNTFGPSSVQKAEPRLDFLRIYPELTKIVMAEWLAEKNAEGVAQNTQPLPTQVIAPSVLRIPSSYPEPQIVSSFTWWRWLLGILALIVLVFTAYAIRKRRR